MAETPPLLELVDISKSFGGVQALRDVDLTLNAGEIHGLVGENGAGKITLMKIIAGVHTGFDGVMRSTGRKSTSARPPMRSPPASAWCIRNSASCRDLTVAENVFLGVAADQPARASSTGTAMRQRRARAARPASASTSIPAMHASARCPIGIQQLVELSPRAVLRGAASSSSTSRPPRFRRPRSERLFAVLRRLREEGRSIIFISHFLDDVLTISDADHDLPQRPQGRDRAGARPEIRQGLDHRAHDRHGATRSSRRAISATPRSPSPQGAPVGAGGAWASAIARPSQDVSFNVQGGRDPRRLRLHGLRADRAGAHACSAS